MTETALLTITDVARRLGVTEKTVRHYIAAGLLDCIRLPGCYRFEPEDLERFIASRRTDKQ